MTKPTYKEGHSRSRFAREAAVPLPRESNHHKGRGEFDPVGTPGNKRTPSRDHYPILKSAGGELEPENVRP
jgi:hypothetical protein